MSMGWELNRRRRGVINAVASRYGVLIDPDLLEGLLKINYDPVEAVGEVLQRLPDRPLVLTLDHFRVMA